VSTSSERPLRLNGGFAGVSHDTHGLVGQDLHATETDNANATVGRDPAENDYDPVQAAYVPKEESAHSTLEDDFALSEDAPHRASEGVRDNTDSPGVNLNHDATSGQPELDRLAASVLSVQREEAAAGLPGAAQLASVPGLAPVDDGVWPPHSLEPDYLPHHDARRGPRTMIKIIFLIVGIFTVPIAYYFLIAGWNPVSSTPPPEVASLKSIIPPPNPSSEEGTATARGGNPATPATGEARTAKSFAGQTVGTPGAHDPYSTTVDRALDLPKPSNAIAGDDDFQTPGKAEPPTLKSTAGEAIVKIRPGTPAAGPQSSTAAPALDLQKPSSQQETAIAGDDDLQTPAKAAPLTAKSSAGETVAMRQPGTSEVQAPPSSPAVRALDAEQIKLLMKQGEQFIVAGDIVTARIAFQRAAEAGDAKAAVALGATYDPAVLAKVGVLGISADVAKARSWYEKAEKLGSPDARRRLEVLADR
jgi:hypothetical protein